MANTLSLGSGNWGAKESLLLGYYEDGKKFFPETFDVTRATSGTRVNKDGLIETPAEIGSELITNGDFSNGSTDWSLDSGWSVVDSKLYSDNSQTGYNSARQNGVTEIGKTYRAKFTLNLDSGVVQVKGSAVYKNYSPSDNGEVTLIFTADSTQFRFTNFPNNTLGTVDNVSVKEYNDKNLARIDYLDDAKGALLTEPQSTNLLTYSQNYNNTYWSKQNGNMLDGGIGLFYLSPLSNVIKYEATTVGYNQMSNRLSSAVTIGTTYTQQGYVKCDNAPYIHFQIHPLTGNPSVVWDNVNKVVISSPASIDNVNIKSLNDGWIKAEITYTATVASQYASIKTYFSTSPTINNSGVPIGTIAFQTFVQVEQLPYATSYIPTDGSTVTRNKDEVNNGGDVNSFGSEGVLYIEGSFSDSSTGASYQMSISDGTGNNRIMIYPYSQTQVGVRLNASSVQLVNQTLTLTNINVNSKIAVAWGGGNYKLYQNGVEIYTQAIANTPTGLSKLNLGSVDGANNLLAKTKNIQVFNTALSDSDLLSLTTTGSVPYWTQYSAMATSLNYTNK